MNTRATFFLDRDYLDNSRVNLQHYLWTKLFGYLLHPDIPTDNKHLRVADIGTATGIWLIDLADILPPTVQLDGFDITLDATAPTQWLPPNVTLQHWDAQTEPPCEWIGAYDVVHIRLFTLVLDETEARSMISRLKKLLKPGGYIQWAELDMSSWRIEKTQPSNPVSAMTQCFVHLRDGTDNANEHTSSSSNTQWTWCTKLPHLFAQEGLEQIIQDVRATPPHLLLPLHECILFTLKTWVAKGMGDERYRGLIRQAERETSQGSAWAFTRWAVVGRKPGSSFGEGIARMKPEGAHPHPHPGGHLFFPY